MGDFAEFVWNTRGDVLRFGKHAGHWYSEVRSIDASYCEWALRQPGPTGQLAEFVSWLRDVGQTSSLKGSLATLDFNWSSSDSSPEKPAPVKRKCSKQFFPARLSLAGSSREQPGAAGSSQEQPGAAGSSQEQPGAAGNGQKQPRRICRGTVLAESESNLC